FGDVLEVAWRRVTIWVLLEEDVVHPELECLVTFEGDAEVLLERAGRFDDVLVSEDPTVLPPQPVGQGVAGDDAACARGAGPDARGILVASIRYPASALDRSSEELPARDEFVGIRLETLPDNTIATKGQELRFQRAEGAHDLAVGVVRFVGFGSAGVTGF